MSALLWALAAARPESAGAQQSLSVVRGGVQLGRHLPLDDVDPAKAPRPWRRSSELTLVAAAGERERAAFVVYSGGHAGRLDVQRPTFASATGEELPATAATLRRVRRVPVRTQYLGSQTAWVGRFAPKFTPHPIAARSFEEVWLELDVPAATPPGVYEAALEVRLGGAVHRRTVRVRVREMSLAGVGDKHLGMYYRVHRRLPEPKRVLRELADMRAHGVDTLVLDVRPRFGWGPKRVLAIDTSAVQESLRLAREAGFHGTVVVESGLVALAQLLGHDDVAYADADGASLDGDDAFADAATKTLSAIEAASGEFPEFDVVVMHVDEIFERGRLPLFERLATFADAARMPTHATLSTATPAYDKLRARIDPVLDVRSHHGYSFEWWLLRGGSVASYRDELRRSGDVAWFYHNERGTYFTGRWARLVNGLYLWASPFSAHITWAYQSFDGSPHDDADGKSHDFGMAFPDPDDPDRLMPTRIWTALSEGHDDLRYLAALERAIVRWGPRAPEPAARARAYLDNLRADVLRLPGGIAVEQLPNKIGTPAEAPLVDALARRYDDAALALMRSRVEEHIVALRVASAGPQPQ